jgi:hypothetical protein
MEKHMRKGKAIFKRIVGFLRMHDKAIDVFIRREPGIASLVWGSVRVLLVVSSWCWSV